MKKKGGEITIARSTGRVKPQFKARNSGLLPRVESFWLHCILLSLGMEGERGEDFFNLPVSPLCSLASHSRGSETGEAHTFKGKILLGLDVY